MMNSPDLRMRLKEALDNLWSRITGRFSTVDERMDDIDDAIDSVESSLDGVTSRVTGVEGRMTTAEGAISTVSGRVDDLEDAVNDLDGDMIKSISLNGTNVPKDAQGNVALRESDPTVPAWAKQQMARTSDFTNDGADGLHPYITAQDVTVPTKTSDLTNDGDDGNTYYVTWRQLSNSKDQAFISEDHIELTPDNIHDEFTKDEHFQGEANFLYITPAGMAAMLPEDTPYSKYLNCTFRGIYFTEKQNLTWDDYNILGWMEGTGVHELVTGYVDTTVGYGGEEDTIYITSIEPISGGGGGGGGDVNIIEAISFNGTNVPPDSGKRVSLTEIDPTVPAWAKAQNPPTYTAADVGAIPTTSKGAASGVAELDASGHVPTSQLPSYVDDVLEYASTSAFPATGEAGKIYVAKDTNLTYRWTGSAYTEISPSLALGETSSTAYRGDRGKAAYDHAQARGSAYASGLYLIQTNSEGHVIAATPVAKADITALGIPAQDTTYSPATQSTAGLMSSSDKAKLDGIASGAQVNSVTGVKGNTESSYRTGNVNLTPENIAFIGMNPTGGTSNDTREWWANKGTCYTFIAGANQVNGQPAEYGFIVNIVYENEVYQMWLSAPGGARYHRGGNYSTSVMPGWTADDTNIITSVNGQTGAVSITPANIGAAPIPTGNNLPVTGANDLNDSPPGWSISHEVTDATARANAHMPFQAWCYIYTVESDAAGSPWKTQMAFPWYNTDGAPAIRQRYDDGTWTKWTYYGLVSKAVAATTDANGNISLDLNQQNYVVTAVKVPSLIATPWASGGDNSWHARITGINGGAYASQSVTVTVYYHAV